jgi:hypothetical protein
MLSSSALPIFNKERGISSGEVRFLTNQNRRRFNNKTGGGSTTKQEAVQQDECNSIPTTDTTNCTKTAKFSGRPDAKDIPNA